MATAAKPRVTLSERIKARQEFKRRKKREREEPREHLARNERSAEPSPPSTFGKCADCGEKIERPRLDLNRVETLCARCDGNLGCGGMEPAKNVIETIPISMEAHLKTTAEILIGEVGPRVWAWGYRLRCDLEGLNRGEIFEPCRVLDVSESRLAAAAHGSMALAKRTLDGWFPADANSKLIAFARRAELHLEEATAEARGESRNAKRKSQKSKVNGRTPASSLAPDPRPAVPADASREAGHVLSTVTPAGIAALDPAAAPSPRSPAPSPSLNDTRSLQADRLVQNDPHERRPYDVPLASLGRNRFNPRERFDEAELQEMAESLVKHGQIQPLVIRHLPDGVTVPSLADPQRSVACEIVAGERRALAALRAGWTRINVMAITCDDARACELAIAENRDRKDISQVEYARGLQKLADLKGLDPAALAADQRLSEQHVRNLFRLLKAPVEWQQRVIDGEIDGTHLRDAVPYLQCPALAEALAKKLKGFRGKPAHAEWEREVRHVVHQSGTRLVETVHTSDWSKQATVRIEPTHPQYAELEVVEVADWGGGKVKLALNTKLAKQILSEKASAWRAKHAVKKKADAKGSRSKQKRAADDERRNRFERLQGIVVFWKCWLCARAIECPLGDLHNSSEVAARAITAAALSMCELPALEREFADFAKERFAPKAPRYTSPPNGSALLLALDAAGFEQLGISAAARLFWSDKMVKRLDDKWFYFDEEWGPEIDRWCKALQIKAADAWRAKGDDGKQQFLGPLTEAWLNLHDRDQLAELAAEWKVPVLEKDSEADLRRKLTGNLARVMPLPTELSELLRGRRPEARGHAKKKPR